MPKVAATRARLASHHVVASIMEESMVTDQPYLLNIRNTYFLDQKQGGPILDDLYPRRRRLMEHRFHCSKCRLALVPIRT